MPLGTELEPSLVPGCSGSDCHSSDSPGEPTTISGELGTRPFSRPRAEMERWISVQGRREASGVRNDHIQYSISTTWS